jgi:hypothetical protein
MNGCPIVNTVPKSALPLEALTAETNVLDRLDLSEPELKSMLDVECFLLNLASVLQLVQLFPRSPLLLMAVGSVLGFRY